jgi:hypothetical protein
MQYLCKRYQIFDKINNYKWLGISGKGRVPAGRKI